MPPKTTPAIPDRATTVIVGAGTSGAVIAHRLALAGEDSVVLLEAGPDYGPLDAGGWPADLLDATTIPTSHDWGYTSGSTLAGREIEFERARVVGGCSAHNGCAQVYGHRLDYDVWAANGNDRWAADDLRPLFATAAGMLRCRTYAPSELTPYQRLFYDVAPEFGLPQLDTVNDLDETVGVAPETVNIVDGVRFNTGFAYLDPVRHLPNLAIAGGCVCSRLVMDRDRAVGVEYVANGRTAVIGADRVVVCAGAYGSPIILQRSGIGDPRALAAAGVEVTVEHRFVGANLHDQPLVSLEFAGTTQLLEEMRACAAGGWAPDEQVMIKALSHTAVGEPAFDLHLLPWSPPDGPDRWEWHLDATCLNPLARGHVTITGPGVEEAPLIDHGFLDDATGHDLAVVVDGVEVLREMASHPSVAPYVGAELAPGPGAVTREDVTRWVERSVQHYWHPAGSCKMGPDTDPEAVVDSDGRLRGVENVIVADCSIIPAIPRATIAITAVVIAERIARSLTQTKGA